MRGLGLIRQRVAAIKAYGFRAFSLLEKNSLLDLVSFSNRSSTHSKVQSRSVVKVL